MTTSTQPQVRVALPVHLVGQDRVDAVIDAAFADAAEASALQRRTFVVCIKVDEAEQTLVKACDTAEAKRLIGLGWATIPDLA